MAQKRRGTKSIKLDNNTIYIGDRFSLTFQRTLRIPEDDKTYPLPPGLGAFPVQRVADFAERLPASWSSAEEALFIPLYQREALWLSFNAASWKPNAVMVGIGDVNALTGEPWRPAPGDQPQNYLVCPEQPWLDGIKVAEGTIRQFVAVPLGQGITVSGQITGAEAFGGLRIVVFEPKPGRFPDEPPEVPAWEAEMPLPESAGGDLDSAGMGVGAGGQMKQKVYPDPYGLDTWDAENYESIIVYLVNSVQYQAITGSAPPPTPISAQTYTQFGLPWFDLYDEEAGDISATETLRSVKPTEAMTGTEASDQTSVGEPVAIDRKQIKKLRQRGATDQDNGN